ncbi:MAG: DUF6428 family protein [Bacteroidota bacterium]
MKLSEVKSKLSSLSEIKFKLPNGNIVPPHFHVTEVGQVNKRFIDCGGTLREEKVINFQLFTADDFDHRLAPQKLARIITLSERALDLEDVEIEVEYQANTIGKYHLDFDGESFLLVNTHTDCLAKDNCGIPAMKPKLNSSQLNIVSNSCHPNSGCC